MPTSSTDLLKTILQECAAALPAPWYPSSLVQETGISRDALDGALDELRLAGLIRLTDWEQGKGQGYTVTANGQKLLQDHRLFDRLGTGPVPRTRPTPPVLNLAEGERPPGWERAKAVRDALLTPSRPIVTLSLIATNVLIFLGGLAIAWQDGVHNEYLSTPLGGVATNDEAEIARIRQADKIRFASGAMNLTAVAGQGQWWRLLGCCFVHFGLLHLALNMYGLYVLGRLLEQMWGGGRFLALYLITGLAGSCAGLIFSPQASLQAGASGAVCGILLSMGTWVFLNRPYLPPALASSWLRGVAINVFLIGFLSLMPGVGAAAHFGGAAAGLVVGVPLLYSRFGRGPQRWLGFLGVLIAPLLCLGLLETSAPFQRAEARGKVEQARKEEEPTPKEVALARQEVKQARARYVPRLLTAEDLSWKANNAVVAPLAQKLKKGEQIIPEEAKAALAEVAKVRAALQEVAAFLEKAEPSSEAAVNQGLASAQQYVTAWSKYFEQFAQCLDARGNWNCGNVNTLNAHIGDVNIATWRLGKSVLRLRDDG